MGAANGSAIVTLVERSTRFTILLHLPGRHDAESVAEAIGREMRKLPSTWAAAVIREFVNGPCRFNLRRRVRLE